MKRIKTFVIGSAVALTAGATAVHAGNPVDGPADPVIVQPVTPIIASTDWTGGYAGAGLGYGDYDLGAANGDGGSLGAFAGYNYDLGTAVVGGEVQLLGNDVNIGGTQLNEVYRVKGRLGYDAGNTLLYTTAGYTHANSSVGSGDGYVAGVGAEYQLNNGMFLGGEYLYNEYDNFAGTGNKLTGNTIEARLGFRF